MSGDLDLCLIPPSRPDLRTRQELMGQLVSEVARELGKPSPYDSQRPSAGVGGLAGGASRPPRGGEPRGTRDHPSLVRFQRPQAPPTVRRRTRSAFHEDRGTLTGRRGNGVKRGQLTMVSIRGLAPARPQDSMLASGTRPGEFQQPEPRLPIANQGSLKMVRKPPHPPTLFHLRPESQNPDRKSVV